MPAGIYPFPIFECLKITTGSETNSHTPGFALTADCVGTSQTRMDGNTGHPGDIVKMTPCVWGMA